MNSATNPATPIVTLYRALNHLDRDDKAFEVLDDGLRRRPEDGELKAYVAMAFGSHGGAERAKALLDEAKPLVRHDVWLRYRADQHRFEAEYAEALACWREIESKSKMDFVAIRNIAQLITALEGEEAARAYLQQQVAAYPHFLELREMAYDWIPAHRLDERLAEVNEAIARNPRNAWAIREKAIILGDMKSFDGPEGAFAILDQAEELQPGVCVVHIVRGRLCEQAKRPDEAREAYARATQLDVDMEYPIRRQLALCKSIDERRAVLETIAQEMSRQVLAGDALFAYRGHAAETYSPGEIADQLREALKARPDLYSAWAALVRQLGDANQLDEAHALAIQTTERFPLLPRAWYDLALICRNRLDDTGERDALDHALRISPGWSMALRTKAEALERSGDFEAARDLALTALRHEPRDSKNHGFLAFYDHKLGKPTEALQSLEKALELDADYEWAWGAYEEWSAEAGQPDKPKEVARRLANERPGEADGWMRLAERLHPLEDAEEVDTALERVLKLQPDSTHALDYKVRVHSFRGEKEEALRLCSAERWPEGVPTTLRERAAIIEHNRGNHAEGLRLAQALVADEPASVSTWCLLCEWHVQSENFEEAMRCADRLLEYEPHSPPTHGYKIHSLIKMGREDDIETDCVRAVRLDPAYLFAGSRLLDLLLRKKRLDEAEQWIVTFRPHWPPDTLIPYDIKLAGARDNAADMEAHIRRLLKTPSEDAHGIQKIQTDYEESDKETSFVILIEEQIDDPDIHPYAASVWARNRIQNGSAKSVIEWLGRQDFPAVAPDKPTARNEVLDAALDEFGRAGERKEFERLLTIYCNVIEADDYLWYQRARAYYNLGEYDTTITAFEGCETRAKLHGVHFLTYINALWNTDRGHQALPVVEYALNLPGNSARQALLVNRSIHCLADELDPNSTLNILGLTFEAGLGEFWSRTRHWLRLLATMTLTDEPKPLQRELKTLLKEKDGLLSSLPEVKRIAYCLDALARNNVHARWCKRWLRKCRRAAKSMQ